MYEKTFEVSESPRITIEDCVGNLSVKGGDVNQVIVHVPDEDALVFDQDGDVIILTVKDNCAITCPVNSTFNLINIQENLKVKKIAGDVTISTVKGNTDLRGVGVVTLDNADGNLRVKTSTGAVEVNQVAGNARIQKIAGSTKLGSLGGSLRAAGLMQGLVAEAVGGTARLEPPYTPGATYQLTAGGNLVISLPDEPNLAFEFTAGGQVKTNVSDLVLSRDGGSVTGTLGEGEAVIAATVGGSVVVGSSSESDSGSGEDINFDFNFDFDPESLAFLEDLGPQIEATVNQAMAQMDTHLAEGLKYFESDEFKLKMEKVAEKAQRIAEKAERQAEGIAERAREQAERAVEKARKHAEHAENFSKQAREQHSTPAPQQTPVEEKGDEQLSILQQIEDGKISAEEAVNLLAAMG